MSYSIRQDSGVYRARKGKKSSFIELAKVGGGKWSQGVDRLGTDVLPKGELPAFEPETARSKFILLNGLVTRLKGSLKLSLPRIFSAHLLRL